MHSSIPLLDFVALLCFLIGCMTYVTYTKRRNINHQQGLLACMNQVREQWANELLERENRIVDSQVINGLLHKETFFASTSLLILASTVALLGVGDEVNQLFREIPHAQPMSLALWELKVSALALIFVYAFFKFTWSIRQSSYCATLLVAMPSAKKASQPNSIKQAKQLARLSNLSARHFNDGMRAFYFALAELGWFYHPWLFMLATVWVLAVLYRREFHSNAFSILRT